MRDIIIVAITLVGIFVGYQCYDDLIAAIGVQDQSIATQAASADEGTEASPETAGDSAVPAKAPEAE